MTSRPPTHEIVRTGTINFANDLAQQRQLMRGRMPAYHRVLEEVDALLAGPRFDPVFCTRLERAWQSRTFPSYYERPLLLLAALRADARADGAMHPLFAAVGSESPDPRAVTRDALRAAVANSRLGFWTTMATRRVQTNETSRAVAWLLPARLAGCDGEAGRPLALLDVGASAGLNLVADALPAAWTDAASGRPLAVAARPRVLARVGLDARPLEATREDDVAWLRACLWPGETERATRLELAVRAMRAAITRGGPSSPRVERSSAATAGRRLAELAQAAPPEALVLAYATVLAGYLSAADRAAYAQGMRAALAAHPRGRLAWIELEVEGAPDARLPATIRAHVRGAGDAAVETIVLARCGYHPSAVELDPDAAAQLESALRV